MRLPFQTRLGPGAGALFFAALLLTASPGCQLFEPEYRLLNPTDPAIANILEQTQGNYELVRQALEQLEGHPVVSWEMIEGQIKAEIVSPMTEAMDTMVQTFAVGAAKNPTPFGLLEGLISAIAGGGLVLAGRFGDKKTKAPVPTVEIKK